MNLRFIQVTPNTSDNNSILFDISINIIYIVIAKQKINNYFLSSERDSL